MRYFDKEADVDLSNLRAPGVPTEKSEKQRAIELARSLLAPASIVDLSRPSQMLIARQLLMALGFSERT